MPPGRDLSIAFNIRLAAIHALARAGAKDRAIEVLQSLVNRESVNGVPLNLEPGAVYHDKFTRLQLGDDPRYQALMKQMEARFEKL
jgi:hypothetical protein